MLRCITCSMLTCFFSLTSFLKRTQAVSATNKFFFSLRVYLTESTIPESVVTMATSLSNKNLPLRVKNHFLWRGSFLLTHDVFHTCERGASQEVGVEAHHHQATVLRLWKIKNHSPLKCSDNPGHHCFPYTPVACTSFVNVRETILIVTQGGGSFSFLYWI